MMFMPLSLAALGPLPKNEIAAGAGIYSLTRQMGSSIGIALITTMVSRRMAAHRSVLVSHITSYRQPVIDRLHMLVAGFGGNGDPAAAQHRALGVIDRIVNGQSALIAYSDIFFYVATAFVVSLPLLFLLGGAASKAANEAAAAAH